MDIRIVGLRKEFDRYPALHDVSLDIRSGELIALLGPSGSGKTTLLRIIAGLEMPTEGKVFFGDEDASRKTVQERNVGFVFQHYALFKHMTVGANVGFGLKVRPRATRPGAREISRRVSELLDLVQLSGLERRFPSQLSGGQRDPLALAIEPRVLLLDEPFGALDAKVRRELRRWLRELHDRTGHTTVFVTHDQDEALELADRVVVMSQGRIEQVGTADEVYNSPGSPFVFSFIGDSSVLPVTVSDGRLLLAGSPLALTPAHLPDGPAQLFVRPHDLVLVEDGPGVIGGRPVAVRRHNGMRRVELAVDDTSERIEVDLPGEDEASLPPRLSVAPLKARVYTDNGDSAAVTTLRTSRRPRVVGA
jgi:sulfate transport system ATP-binding protein